MVLSCTALCVISMAESADWGLIEYEHGLMLMSSPTHVCRIYVLLYNAQYSYTNAMASRVSSLSLSLSLLAGGQINLEYQRFDYVNSDILIVLE